MPLDEPSWWYDDRPSIWPLILSPLSNLYGTLALRRLARDKPYRSRLAVVCVGNFTAGGTGKTPFAITIARLLHEMGERQIGRASCRERV